MITLICILIGVSASVLLGWGLGYSIGRDRGYGEGFHDGYLNATVAKQVIGGDRS